MNNQPSNDTDRLIVRFIGDYQIENQCPPTIREVMVEVGLTSTSVTKYRLDRLVRHNHLQRFERGTRQYGLMKNPKPPRPYQPELEVSDGDAV